MCIGIPMQVLDIQPGHARVSGRGEVRVVNTALIDAVEPGEWVLVFLDSAREHITPERAAEVNATLDLVASVMGPGGMPGVSPFDEASFDLPSAMSAEQLAVLSGGVRR